MINSSNTESKQLPRLIIVMGVSGSGKSTLAKKLADKLAYQFVEADDFHSTFAKNFMANGVPLTDELRKPWIDALSQFFKRKLNDFQANNNEISPNTVLAYSALRTEHRQVFRMLGYQTVYIYLSLTQNIIESRLAQRTEHFFSPKLLQSQFDALQLPNITSKGIFEETDFYKVDGDQPLAAVLSDVSYVIEQALL